MKEDKQPINQPDQDNALEGLINTPDRDVLSVPLLVITTNKEDNGTN